MHRRPDPAGRRNPAKGRPPSKSGLRDDPAARKTLRHTAHGTGGNERPFAYAYDPKRTAGESRPAARGRGTGTDFEFSERLGSEVRNGHDGHFRHPSPQTLRAEAGRGSRPMPMRQNYVRSGSSAPNIRAMRSATRCMSHLGVDVAPQIPTERQPSNHSGRSSFSSSML